ncbi:MAG: Gfo/Idh/MocA family oxidoreductase, partial [Flavobacteriaceae bacterium]|nr:Gfo/Idh/MocA family oxidoreductase [Flavobacteriaceae bacterium]
MNRKNFLTNLGAMGATTLVAPTILASSLKKENLSLNRKIKVGIIGCGSVSGQYMPHLSKSPHAQIVSVCDIKPERAQSRAKEFNIPNWYPHIDKMLAGEDFDLLVNLTDMQEHGRLNRIAIDHGKNVWCEKPLANSYAEGVEILKLAKNKGVKIWGAPVVVNS